MIELKAKEEEAFYKLLKLAKPFCKRDDRILEFLVYAITAKPIPGTKNLWSVLSKEGGQRYNVDVITGSCSCPAMTGRCLHPSAVGFRTKLNRKEE